MHPAEILPRYSYLARCATCGAEENITDYGRVTDAFAQDHREHGITLHHVTEYLTQDTEEPLLIPEDPVHP